MRCVACDVVLTDYEATRKSLTTGDYMDMCNKCFGYIKHDVHSKERLDLKDISDDCEESDEDTLTDW